MVRCHVKGCGRSAVKDKNHHFFQQPTKSELRKKWREFAQVPGNPTHLRVCSDHFEPNCMRKRFPRPLLFPDSIPTISPVQLSQEITNIVKRERTPSFEESDLQDPLDISSETVSSQPSVEKPSTAGSIDLPTNAKQQKSDISLPPPEIGHEASNVRSILSSIPKISTTPVQKPKDAQKVKPSENVMSSSSKLLEELKKPKSQNKTDDDITVVETPQVLIDLCDDETNDAHQNSNDDPVILSADKTSTGAPTGSKKDDTFFLTPQNISTVCRACLKLKDALHMSENKYEDRTFAEILEVCTSTKVEDEHNLSPYICKECINELLQAYKFREKCKKSEETLRNFKGYLDKCHKKQESDNERQKNLTLRFHDYESILNEDDVNNITSRKRHSDPPEDVDPANSTIRTAKKRFYLLKGQISGTEGFKGDVNVTEIDEKNAKTLMCDTHKTAVSLQVGNAICNIKTAVVQPEKCEKGKDGLSVPKNSIVIKSHNKRRIIPYSVLLRPALRTIFGGRMSNINSRILKKKATRKRKRNPDKVPKIRDKKPVIPGSCHICDEPYNTLAEYKQHSRVTKHYLNPYVCETCGKIYPDQGRLKMHITISHESRRSQMCEVCGKCFKTRSYLLIHLKTHDLQRKRFACRECGKTFVTRREIIHHRKTTHTALEKKHCCEFCGDFFARPDTLRHHRNRVHLKIKHIFCQICGKGYQYKSSLNKHMISHSTHLIDCNLCNKTFKMDHRYEQHMKNQHPGATEASKEDDEIRIMECEYCTQKLKNKQSQSMHVRIDHEADICLYCDRLFDTPDELTAHMTEFHADISDFSCRYCGRCFEECPMLYSHLSTHKPKYYQCNVCFKKFANTMRLKIHMVFHTREKMFACKYCDKGFLYSSSRVIHERLHTGERPYVCDICGKGNVCISSYKRHRRTHIMPVYDEEALANEEAVASIQIQHEEIVNT